MVQMLLITSIPVEIAYSQQVLILLTVGHSMDYYGEQQVLYGDVWGKDIPHRINQSKSSGMSWMACDFFSFCIFSPRTLIVGNIRTEKSNNQWQMYMNETSPITLPQPSYNTHTVLVKINSIPIFSLLLCFTSSINNERFNQLTWRLLNGNRTKMLSRDDNDYVLYFPLFYECLFFL
jgi:hypothetical protein